MKIDGRETPLSFEGSVGRKVEYGVRIKRPIYLQILVVQETFVNGNTMVRKKLDKKSK